MVNECYLNDNVSFRYRLFIYDLVKFLKNEIEKHDNPTLYSKEEYLEKTLNIIDFIKSHSFFNKFNFTKYILDTDLNSVLNVLKPGIIANMLEMNVKSQNINTDKIPDIYYSFRPGKYIKINAKKLYELGFIELPFVKYSFDYDNMRKSIYELSISKNTSNKLIDGINIIGLIQLFKIDKMLNDIENYLFLANEIYKQAGTQPEEYLVAKNIMIEMNQNINKFFKKDIETGEQCLSDDKYNYMVKIIFDFMLTENKDQQNIYFKIVPDYENMNFKIDFYPNGEPTK